MNRHLIIIIALLLALLIGSGYAVTHYRSKYLFEQGEKESVQKAYGKTMAEVETYKNIQGQMVTKNETLTLDNNTLREMVKEGYLQQISQLGGVKNNLKNLEFVYKITAKAMDSLLAKLNDTTRYYITDSDTVFYRVSEFSYKDQWVEINETQLSPFESKVDYTFTVPLTGAMFWDRKWFLGKKTYWGEATSENPHVVIPELVNIKVGRRKKN